MWVVLCRGVRGGPAGNRAALLALRTGRRRARREPHTPNSDSDTPYPVRLPTFPSGPPRTPLPVGSTAHFNMGAGEKNKTAHCFGNEVCENYQVEVRRTCRHACFGQFAETCELNP